MDRHSREFIKNYCAVCCTRVVGGSYLDFTRLNKTASYLRLCLSCEKRKFSPAVYRWLILLPIPVGALFDDDEYYYG